MSDDFLLEVNKLDITGTVEVISEVGPLISTGDIIAIVVAVISVIGVVITTIMTNRTTKKINKENNNLQDRINNSNLELQARLSKENSDLQERWNQKNIDANLIAQARIEWIQNVRKTTSELLVNYFTMLNLANVDNIDQELMDSQEKNELLILYFGNDNTDTMTVDLVRERILDEKTNKGKNDMLVILLLDLAKRFSEYSISVKKDKTSKLRETVDEARRTMYANATQRKIGEEYIEEIGDVIPIEESVYQDEDVQDLGRAEIALEREKKKIELLQRDLMLLRDAIRTYLKIEWEIAKQGK